ncbi:tyrosine-type recombinase/integrase [Dethiosulfovibrio salsuginis]|uniref:Phage integrase family protein n=1 Tax=Dethiosulfovibrio salsuginis TaxID=561720 RepID=A0A1X7L146_9BACT|nr:tyrosine-type recombinase/integrase [Dethiosulfovibrio salsuginis]SMG47337.1 Phage integrase family protein [Dethiosulfovibrio salsuginis]
MREVTYFTKDEIRRIPKILRSRDRSEEVSLRDCALFMVGINSALRAGDLLGLKVGDILAGSAKRIQIRKEIILVEGKTKKERWIYLPDSAREAVKAYLKVRKDRRGLLPEQPLWMSTRGKEPKAISYVQVYRTLRWAARRAGADLRLRHIGCHSMRKTYGHWLYYKTEGEPFTLAELMFMYGHSSEQITLRYLGITARELREKARNSVIE